MSSIARIHHYLPQCYLKRFARHERKPKLFVVDLKLGKSYATNPANVAAERDFNRVDVDGLRPDALETAYSRFEAEVDTALRRVTESSSFTNAQDRTVILNLIALIAVRNPRLRETVRDFMERISKSVLGVMLASPERWEEQTRQMKDAGYDAPSLPYQQMKDFHERDQYAVNMPTLGHIQNELEVFDPVLRTMGDRKWRLLRTDPRVNSFITTDHPVCLLWKDPNMRRFRGPGYGMRGSELLFPLTKQLALIGTFEGSEREDDVLSAYVAAFNSQVATFAQRQVFAQDGQFFYFSGKRLRRGVDMRLDANFARRARQMAGA